MQGIVIREVDRTADAAAIQLLDTSFVSHSVYRVEHAKDELRLRLVTVPSPVEKRYSIDLEHQAWDRGYVAEDQKGVYEFIATSFEAWNRRLVIWHFYVDLVRRQQGIGRALLNRAIADGPNRGVTTVWVETSNNNQPAVVVYQRLGFSICGFDLTLYRGTPSEREFGLFLGRALSEPGGETD